ncbi:type II CRISPR-associated endonuclease Cas1 [Laribacter hongkongensis]|uniref:Type II CRISPR-associated endonuclease Cas1 n=1 Tax=Laribacter hongkongensis TaxID=168471 RepID=A0ABD4SS11_9NEIS|nr:type II CRISPR-associated endonuclease Cas1 [Laribacter hongkongensis]MCG9026078.1 type II CRISPR-associated endonuclease Cas1 [Laribacter hongkongensis]MCG9101984.1 type II CRISPR-associated endonuclease Cas1 [Laribacter hongkongensis]MCG9119694.1 type II CRISPR-associated endonuclease Cas1 [Laribacter hongkongensis]
MSEHRILLIEHQAHLCVSLGRLAIRRRESRDVFVLPADIAVLCLHHPEVTLTVAALQTLATAGVCVLITDGNHHPLAQFYPQLAPMRLTLRLHQQWQLYNDGQASGALWQRIVQTRLAGQSACLEAMGCKGGLHLRRLAERVEPGDASHCEATGARHYWKQLFGAGFNRLKQGATDELNVRLNYGYAVLRALIARNLACCGLNGSLAVGHHSQENPFNLADDLIEPYRFLVEYQTARMWRATPDAPFDGTARKALLNILIQEIPMQTGTWRLPAAIESTVASWVRMLDAHRAGKALPRLDLPECTRWASMVGE